MTPTDGRRQRLEQELASLKAKIAEQDARFAAQDAELARLTALRDQLRTQLFWAGSFWAGSGGGETLGMRNSPSTRPPKRS